MFVSKISPELNTDFEFPYSKLEIYQQRQQILTCQKRWRHILYFCMLIIQSLISVDVILRFMSHIVESNAENYEKRFIVKFRQSLKMYRI